LNQSVKRHGTVFDAGQEHKRQVIDLGTKSRSENDIYEILGRLRAAEAVPILVAIMEEEEIDNMIQGMSPVMRALAEIGSAAVPELIRSINEAKVTASDFPEPRGSDISEEARQWYLGIIQGRIELRATLVLGEIGDRRAIPALERLQSTSDNQFIQEQAREAIRKIQDKSAQPDK
jgi:HEAT repeat protein